MSTYETAVKEKKYLVEKLSLINIFLAAVIMSVTTGMNCPCSRARIRVFPKFRKPEL